MNLGYLAQTLYSTKTAEVTYEVKKGDTWSQIANSHDLTSVQLLALNPGYNIDKLQIGEVLTLSASVPYLTMTVVQRERYIDDVPFEIEYTDTANLYKGDYKVTSAQPTALPMWWPTSPMSTVRRSSGISSPL